MKKIILTLSLALLISPAITLAYFDTNLKVGSTGVEVEKVQKFLVDKKLLSAKTFGTYGLATKKAVQKFQKSNSLLSSGTWATSTRVFAESLIKKDFSILSTQPSQKQVLYTSDADKIPASPDQTTLDNANKFVEEKYPTTHNTPVEVIQKTVSVQYLNTLKKNLTVPSISIGLTSKPFTSEDVKGLDRIVIGSFMVTGQIDCNCILKVNIPGISNLKMSGQTISPTDLKSKSPSNILNKSIEILASADEIKTLSSLSVIIQMQNEASGELYQTFSSNSVTIVTP